MIQSHPSLDKVPDAILSYCILCMITPRERISVVTVSKKIQYLSQHEKLYPEAKQLGLINEANYFAFKSQILNIKIRSMRAMESEARVSIPR